MTDGSDAGGSDTDSIPKRWLANCRSKAVGSRSCLPTTAR